MGLSKQLKAVVLISLLCLTVVAFAKQQSDVRKEQLDKELGKSQKVKGSAALSDEITFPEDTTPRFSVKALKISGN